MKETDLYKPVKDLLMDNGFNIKAEVSDVDIAAEKNDRLTIVELKTSLNLKLLIQAAKRQRIADDVYVAVPRPSYKRRFQKEVKDREFLLRRLGIGLIYVAADIAEPYAAVAFEPALFDMARSKNASRRKRKKVVKEFNGRTADFNIAGSVRTQLVTVYRENALRIAYHLGKNGKMTTRELRESGCSEKTTKTLYNNHYGWFIKTGRAEYELSDKGLEALSKYADVVKHIVKDIDND
ncbi:MAG: DUF2161 family putative PD-(D/E)XK-type phosphodiesterase [Clostridia bacterium]|nr:DUF2161 family putative PD-(D/E)XK-type phosphodiesterase [Clostridia bacterium]